MADECIKREAAIKAYTDLLESPGDIFTTDIAVTLKYVPAVDVVPVVRCKDCKYCLQTDEFEYWCDGFCSPARLVRKEDFCSHGKARD